MATLKDLYIVIAEDDADDSEMIHQSFLSHPAFSKITMVKNGRELLDLLCNNDEKKPDIVLTDINMPLINGIEALKAIQKDLILKDIATFAYSTSTTALYINKCLEFGALFFFIKSVVAEHFDEIPVKLHQILEQQLE